MIEIVEVDGEWAATVTWRASSGRRLVEQKSFRRRPDAVTWAQERDRVHSEEVRQALTVAQLVMCWHDDRRPQLRETTIVREESILTKHVAGDLIGAMPARSVTRRDAYDFGERLKLRENGRGACLAPRTRRHIQKSIRQAFDASWEIENNPFSRVALPSLPDTEAEFLALADIDRLLKHTDSHKWGWVYGVLVLTGLRRSELCGLRWADVDLDAGHLDVRWRRTTAGPDIVEGPPKTRRARRRIPLDPMARRLLQQRAEQRDGQREVWGVDWCTDGDTYVWAREDGSLASPDLLTAEFDKFCKCVGIPNVGLHGLRHSFAATAIAAGVSGYPLSRVMGHSQVTFTYTVYGHLFNDGLQGEMAKLSGLLGTGTR